MELAEGVVAGLDLLSSLQSNEYEELVERTFAIVLRRGDESLLERSRMLLLFTLPVTVL